jgi:hypothetical protein
MRRLLVHLPPLGSGPVETLKRVALKRIQATRFRSFCFMHVVAAKPRSLLRDMH